MSAPNICLQSWLKFLKEPRLWISVTHMHMGLLTCGVRTEMNRLDNRRLVSLSLTLYWVSSVKVDILIQLLLDLTWAGVDENIKLGWLRTGSCWFPGWNLMLWFLEGFTLSTSAAKFLCSIPIKGGLAFMYFQVFAGQPRVYINGASSGFWLAWKLVAFSFWDQPFTAFFLKDLLRQGFFFLILLCENNKYFPWLWWYLSFGQKYSPRTSWK